MATIREYSADKEKINSNDCLLFGHTWESIMVILANDRRFMYPDDNDIRDMTKEDYRKDRAIRLARDAFYSSVWGALDELEDNIEMVVKLTAPREKVIDGEVKTLQGWIDSEKNLGDYLKEGDKVAFDIIMEQADCLPPETYTSTMMQSGEPYDCCKQGNRYSTFILLYSNQEYESVWQYCGYCLSGTTDHGTSIPRV